MNTTDFTRGRAASFEAALTFSGARAGSALVIALFTSTLFVSAFLLFLIQPMVAKMVLPMLGGAPMVWNTCMVFFQVALLAGYAYAHGATSRIRRRPQVALHVALLMLPFTVLPFVIQRESVSPPEGAPIVWLLLLLAGAIGLPFFVLATSASVLQHWFSRTDHPSARDPYFLYAASNIGSFMALMAYPAIVEPLLSLRDQSRLWAGGYATFVALVGACAIVAWRGNGSNAVAHANETTSSAYPLAEGEPLSVRRRARWVALAFVPSSLMLAVTTYLSTDIAAVPLLWIVPLGLYLLTFIAAFSSKGHSLRKFVSRTYPLLLVPLVLLLSSRATGFLSFTFPMHVLTFVAAALLCHGRLAEDRPAAAHLTEFYLWISFGGMLGGLFNGLAAPVLFDSVLEYPLVLVLACLMLPTDARQSKPSGRKRLLDFAWPLATGGLTVAAVSLFSAQTYGTAVLQAAVAVPALLAFSQRRKPLRFALSIGALLLAGLTFGNTAEPVLHAERTFFGVYRVTQDRKAQYRALAHGTTLHGMQAIAGPEHREPLTYFHRGGPFGQAFAALPRAANGNNVAVIGLGVGTLAAYAQPAQSWTFYEIDEAVERIARDARYFDYLGECGDRCRVVIGDARLSLERASESQYDLLVLDAFSSDSIPVHLLTSEALALYLTRLRPGGAMLFHISNGHLQLAPIVARLAEQHDLVAYVNFDKRTPDWPPSRLSSMWVAMGRRPEDLGTITSDSRWKPLTPAPSTPLWTDDFSNILSVLSLR